MDAFGFCGLILDHKAHEFDDFESEKCLCNFIEEQKEIFAKEVLGIHYVNHTREYYISEDRRVNKNKKGRVDFRFGSPDGDIYVECKSPTQSYSESVEGLTQLMAYSCLADGYKRNLHRLVLVTTRFNPIINQVLTKYKLPIEVYILSKKNVMKLIVGGCHGRY